MTGTTDEMHIRSWLASLADATVAGSEPVTPERIATVAALLMGDDLPRQAFCTETLRMAARAHRFFPAYADVSDLLRDWWAEHRPSVPLLPGQGQGDQLERADRSWLVFWNTRRAEILDAGGGSAMDTALASLASLVRQQSPRAWAVIRGPERGVPAPTPEQVASVRTKLDARFPTRRAVEEGREIADPAPGSGLQGDALAAMRANRTRAA